MALYISLRLPSLQSIPQERVSSQALSPKERGLPFYELMSPVAVRNEGVLVPKLEYKRGPPERFLDRISLVFEYHMQFL